MTAQIGFVVNAVISVAYLAISVAILTPLVRAGQLRANRLGTSTAAIFLSCSVGHGLHAYAAVVSWLDRGVAHHVAVTGPGWESVVWDAVTAAVAVNYWTQRRTYGALMKGAALFSDLEEQRRHEALRHREDVASARSAADREREAESRRLAAVIANSQALIHVKDLTGRYLLANEPFLRMFDVREGELLGQTDELIDATLAPVWRANDRRAQRGRIEAEEWSDGDDGRNYYDSVKFPLLDTAGEVYATCGISLDVTDRRRALDEVTRARDQALAATQAKSSFLATMSHEIRTPMNAVIGMTGLLLETELKDEQRDLAESVCDSGNALLMIINDILDFSKVEAGELELEERLFDLRGCIEGAVGLVAFSAEGKGLELVAEVDEGCPALVVGDAGRFRQVVTNLVTNATKFTARGEVVVTVTAQPAPAPPDRSAGPGRDVEAVQLAVAVQDTGIGIAADRMDRLFRSFSQVDSSTTRTHGGTGLGLAISRRLARAMGGDLVVTSEEGAGSTFTFTAVLPVGVDRRRAADHGAGALAGLHVLLVDDSTTSAAVLGRQLGRWGMSCTAVTTAAEAHDHIARGGVDVAVLDIRPDGVDGVHLAADIRARPASAQLPMLLMTGLQGTLAPQERALFAATLSKPVRSHVLEAKLLGALRPVEAALAAVETAGGRRAGDERSVEPARSLRVLLAEDNVVNQKVAYLMLTRLGHTVDIVSDGFQALEALRARDYDAVLMDMQMPLMDGLRATELLRAELPAHRQPYVVAMTANVQPEDRAACVRVGMDGYLSKPVRPAELAQALARPHRPAPSVNLRRP